MEKNQIVNTHKQIKNWAKYCSFKHTKTEKLMFAVIYTFEVREEKEFEFIGHWSELTKIIFEHAGSLGSRLHRGSNNKFIAYALWPNKTVFEAASSKLPEKSQTVSEAMRNCCISIQSEFKGNMIKDLIRN